MDLGNNVYAPLNTIAHKHKERDWSQNLSVSPRTIKFFSKKSERLRITKPTGLMLDFVTDNSTDSCLPHSGSRAVNGSNLH